MDFLDRFSPGDRERLVAAARTVRLMPGEFLLRRGERGGDVFRVAEGELEVIDTRSQPAVILDVIGRGAVVGEMAFLDESPRSADVRAHEGATCQRWDRPVLLRVLAEDPALAANFYRVVAELVSERARTVQTNVMTGAMAAAHGPRGEGSEASRAIGEALAEGLRRHLITLEPALRRDREVAAAELRVHLAAFEGAVNEAIARLDDREAAAAGAAMARALEPFVMRAHLGEVALERTEGRREDGPRLAHVLAAAPEGDGPLGEVLDAWLLDLPTMRGLQRRRVRAAEMIASNVAAREVCRAVVVNAGGGGAALDVHAALADRAAEIVLVDDDREQLAALDARLTSDAGRVVLRLAQDDLASLALGRSRLRFPGRDLIVIDGLLEYLPERAASALLRWAAQQLVPGGAVVCTSLVPSSDAFLVRHLLGWPAIRRGRASLASLVEAAGFGNVEVQVDDAGAAVVGYVREAAHLSAPLEELAPIA
jgi:extracellular factor (EF) 3-hydroxypalmitic acid methyl ester biosynthesis protein